MNTVNYDGHDGPNDLIAWEIVNPSDPYTIEAPSFAVAAAATLLLGQGKFGLEPENDAGPSMPLFLFGGHEDFVAQNLGVSLDEFILANVGQVAAALDSVLLGGFRRRKDYAAAVAAIDDPIKLEAFRDTWHDSRSSENDIGASAWRIADKLRLMS